MTLTVPLAIDNLISPLGGHLNIFGSIYLAILPLLICFGFVFLSSLLIGLPGTAILRFRNIESTFNYQMMGGVAGFFVPLIGLLMIDGVPTGLWMCFLGAVAGTTTATSWSKQA